MVHSDLWGADFAEGARTGGGRCGGRGGDGGEVLRDFGGGCGGLAACGDLDGGWTDFADDFSEDGLGVYGVSSGDGSRYFACSSESSLDGSLCDSQADGGFGGGAEDRAYAPGDASGKGIECRNRDAAFQGGILGLSHERFVAEKLGYTFRVFGIHPGGLQLFEYLAAIFCGKGTCGGASHHACGESSACANHISHTRHY